VTTDIGPRPSVDDEQVRLLVQRLNGDGPVADLGGTMSLNIHLIDRGLVLRIHRPFVDRARLAHLHSVRAAAANAGLDVAEPIDIDAHPFTDAGNGRVAELEAYIAHDKPPPTWDSYRWMYGAMGALHHALDDFDGPLADPVVATYGTPATLRRAVRTTIASVPHDQEATQRARNVDRLIDVLANQWIEPRSLPNRVVHGDIRLGNVARTTKGDSAYFDFGFAARRPRIHDLAYSLAWIIFRPTADGRGEDFPWDALPDLIDAYEQAAGSRLDELERRALGPYLAAVPLYLAAIASHTPDPVEHLAIEAPFVRIAEWVLQYGIPTT